ncbi:uncharacterized protein LOC128558402 [Mercenaria mercenaria]|uniref:uncharacterized protein LOC128558402 n=1 Tax=Mercenaria mercenaria TaxID=6596 RepID=UPI00234F79D0|nr:uncharacterized protein LOC128558402 [Mercenaria mercenaria]
MKSGNDGNHDNQEDFVDDVFQSPEVFHRQRIDSQTYLVRQRVDNDANNNSVKSSCSNVEKDQTKNYVNTTMVQALSVSKFNIELTKNILYDEIRLKIGNKQCDHLISQVRQLIVEDGQSYQCLRHKLIKEELELLPLICMYLTV